MTDITSTGRALFEGDTSTMPIRLRQALVMLLKNTYIDGVRHPEHFAAIVEGRETVAQWLNSIFLTIDIDEETRTVFKRPAAARTDFTQRRVVANTRKLRLYEAALLVWAREQCKRAQQEGLKSITVTREEICAGLQYLDVKCGTDETIHMQEIDDAIRTLIAQRFISPVNTEDSDALINEYRLLPIIVHVMNARRVEAFTDALATLHRKTETEDGVQNGNDQ